MRKLLLPLALLLALTSYWPHTPQPAAARVVAMASEVR